MGDGKRRAWKEGPSLWKTTVKHAVRWAHQWAAASAHGLCSVNPSPRERDSFTTAAEMPSRPNRHYLQVSCYFTPTETCPGRECQTGVPGAWLRCQRKGPVAYPRLTSWIFSFTRLSEGCRMVPITFMLPQTTRASSGASVFIPTRPWQMTASGTCPRCHSASLSFSNCPGLEAWGNRAACPTVKVMVAETVHHESSPEQRKTDCYLSPSREAPQ